MKAIAILVIMTVAAAVAGLSNGISGYDYIMIALAACSLILFGIVALFGGSR